MAKKTAGTPDENTLIDLSELFKIFGDSTRIKILFTLFQLLYGLCLSGRLHYNKRVLFFGAFFGAFQYDELYNEPKDKLLDVIV